MLLSFHCDFLISEFAEKLVLKKVDRKPFLAEIKKGYKLKHVNTRDGSKPVLDSM